MSQPFAVCRGQRLRELADELIRLMRLQRPGGEQLVEWNGVGQPLMDDIDQLALLDRVEDLHEPGVTEQGRRACRGKHLTGAGVPGRHHMHPDGTAQLLVDGTPAAEAVEACDALLEAVALGQLVTAVQFRHPDVGGSRRGSMVGVGLCVVRRFVCAGLVDVLVGFCDSVRVGLRDSFT
jgi:hypothetical protein